MKTILVSGATGHQGSAVVQRLIRARAVTSEQAYRVIAITRDTLSDAAHSLQRLDHSRIDLIRCNLNDGEEVRRIFDEYKGKGQDIYGVFCVLAFPGLGKPAGSVERQGKLLIDCAIEYGVKHFVFSSVDRGGYEHDDEYTLDRAAKVAIERHLKKTTEKEVSGDENSRMIWTILLPGFFMINFLGSIGKITTGVLREGLKPDTKLQLVDIGDIGKVARVVFDHPEIYASKSFTIASQSLTSAERDEAYQRGTKSGSSKAGLPSVPAFVSRMLIKWNDHTKALCADIERVYQVHLSSGNGDPEKHLETVKEALRLYASANMEEPQERGLTTFEEFCARSYPGGRLYGIEGEEAVGQSSGQESWNGLSVTGLVKDGLTGKDQSL